MHEQASAILVQRATRDAPSLRSVAPDVPAPVAELIDQCLARDPGAPPGDRVRRSPSGSIARARTRSRWPPRRVPGRRSAKPTRTSCWRRAAQLQAEAAARLEARTRELRALQSPDGDGRGDDRSRARRVRRLSRRAGAIGGRRSGDLAAVRRARAGRTQCRPRRGEGARGARDRRRLRWCGPLLGKHPRTITVSRTFDHAPREVLTAIGHALQRPPAGLRLRETLGGHALHGGVLVFDLPVVNSYGLDGIRRGRQLSVDVDALSALGQVDACAADGRAGALLALCRHRSPSNFRKGTTRRCGNRWDSARGARRLADSPSLILAKKALRAHVPGLSGDHSAARRRRGGRHALQPPPVPARGAQGARRDVGRAGRDRARVHARSRLRRSVRRPLVAASASPRAESTAYPARLLPRPGWMASAPRRRFSAPGRSPIGSVRPPRSPHARFVDRNRRRPRGRRRVAPDGTHPPRRPGGGPA